MNPRRFSFVPLLCLLFPVSLAAQQSAVELSGAWIRALPPTQPVTAAYVDIHNAGDAVVEVNGAAVEGVGRAEIHVTREVDGRMRMEQLTTLSVPAGETRSLAPGGIHLMLFELQGMPQPGETRRLCLSLVAGGEVCTPAEVRTAAEGADGHAHHH